MFRGTPESWTSALVAETEAIFQLGSHQRSESLPTFEKPFTRTPGDHLDASELSTQIQDLLQRASVPWEFGR